MASFNYRTTSVVALSRANAEALIPKAMIVGGRTWAGLKPVLSADVSEESYQTEDAGANWTPVLYTLGNKRLPEDQQQHGLAFIKPCLSTERGCVRRRCRCLKTICFHFTFSILFLSKHYERACRQYGAPHFPKRRLTGTAIFESGNVTK